MYQKNFCAVVAPQIRRPKHSLCSQTLTKSLRTSKKFFNWPLSGPLKVFFQTLQTLDVWNSSELVCTVHWKKSWKLACRTTTRYPEANEGKISGPAIFCLPRVQIHNHNHAHTARLAFAPNILKSTTNFVPFFPMPSYWTLQSVTSPTAPK